MDEKELYWRNEHKLLEKKFDELSAKLEVAKEALREISNANETIWGLNVIDHIIINVAREALDKIKETP